VSEASALLKQFRSRLAEDLQLGRVSAYAPQSQATSEYSHDVLARAGIQDSDTRRPQGTASPIRGSSMAAESFARVIPRGRFPSGDSETMRQENSMASQLGLSTPRPRRGLRQERQAARRHDPSPGACQGLMGTRPRPAALQVARIGYRGQRKPANHPAGQQESRPHKAFSKSGFRARTPDSRARVHCCI